MVPKSHARNFQHYRWIRIRTFCYFASPVTVDHSRHSLTRSEILINENAWNPSAWLKLNSYCENWKFLLSNYSPTSSAAFVVENVISPFLIINSGSMFASMTWYCVRGDEDEKTYFRSNSARGQWKVIYGRLKFCEIFFQDGKKLRMLKYFNGEIFRVFLNQCEWSTCVRAGFIDEWTLRFSTYLACELVSLHTGWFFFYFEISDLLSNFLLKNHPLVVHIRKA